jgi:2,3-bisphosphoglycerate-dependent phosphoglycerate mutase
MIVLVRHGETEGNAARVVQREDSPLNARGLAQAERLAERVASLGAQYLLCSDLPRARMTAEPLIRRTGARTEYTPLLQERNFGDLRGRPYAEIDTDIFHADFVPPGGESWAMFDDRVDRAWARVLELSATVAGNLVVLTHGLVCASIAGRLLDRSGCAPLPPRWGNTSVTLCAKQPPHAVSLLNCVAHLDGVRDDAAGAKV